uniref:Uncharacterized protein n=1 Tax=Kalanchoe fedtschenkoi TaxID=63787 RepID=A0A7N0TAH2_KALFE
MSLHPGSVSDTENNSNRAAENGEDGKKKKSTAARSVPFLKLFKFADLKDWQLMAVGSIGACVHGASLPVFFIFFGKMIDVMGLAYLNPPQASHKVAKYALDFVYLSAVILFSSWIEVACWMHTGERQAAKMRLAYLKSMFNQDISLFDTEASTGEVISAITNDILIVQDAIAEKVIGNVRTVQAFAAEEAAVRSYRAALLKTFEYGKKAGLAKGIGLGSMHCTLFLSWALLVWFVSIIVHKGISNGGDSFTTMINVVIAGWSLGQAAPDMSAFVRAKAAAYSIFEMIERDTVSQKVSSNGKTLSKIEGHIQFREVSFSYPSRPDAVIFDKFNLDIPAGKIVALVGGSGSGKSTVISLIERFYRPLSGEILLDGRNIQDLDVKWLRKQIGLVNQEPVLFATTIRENILYGKGDATDDEIIHAAKLSEALSFVSNLPDKFETQVGERGVQLSGGQKQRIAISRAIVKNPSILLLDEATSALDAESEKSVQEALDRAMVGRTTVVVAHRLSTIRNADIIGLVKNGVIVETGSHEELMSNPNSAYAALAHLQHVATLKSHSLKGSTLNRPLSAKYSRELTRTKTNSSFRSDVHSVNSQEKDTKATARVSVKRIYSMVGPDWIYGVVGAVAALAAGAQMPLFAVGVSQALVSYYMEWDMMRHEIKKIAILFCCGAVVSVFVHSIQHLFFGIMGERLTLRVRQMIFSAILRNEIGFFDDPNNTSAMLSSRLETDATFLRTVVVDRSTLLIMNIGSVVSSFVIAFILNWRLTLVVLATYPLTISGHLSERLFLRGFGGDLSKAYLRANMLAGEAVGNIRTVAAFCSEDKILNLYARELVEPSRRSFIRGQIAGLLYGITQFFIFSAYGLALWYGSVLMGKEIASFKSIMKTFLVLVITALGIGDTLILIPDLLKGSQMVASVFEMMDRQTEIVADCGEELAKVEGTVELRGVAFSYPSRPEVTIFKNFDLRVEAGRSMAIVGQSGSGKSSVLSLILRFYDPSAGRVMIDGKDIRKLHLKSVRRHIGLVQQEPALFATTIYENISYGKEGSSESEVIEAARLANAHIFISALPGGYSTQVGERGVQLSGGQKQRIAIARAVLKNPKILLLDEATSALDAESERVVQQALDGLMENRSSIIVAHRLSTIKNADQISVIQDGKIVQQGTHSSLAQTTDGAYFKLINLQQQQQKQQAPQ